MTNHPDLTREQLQDFRFTLECLDPNGNTIERHKGVAPVWLPVEYYFKTIVHAVNTLRYPQYLILPSKQVRNYFGRPESFIEAFYAGVEYGCGHRDLDNVIALIHEGDYRIAIMCHFPKEEGKTDVWF